jgi:hypothetical protein
MRNVEILKFHGDLRNGSKFENEYEQPLVVLVKKHL